MLQVDEDNEATRVVRCAQVPYCSAHFPGRVHGCRTVPRPRRTRRNQHHVAPGRLQSIGQQFLLGMCGTLLTVGHPVAAASVEPGPRASNALRLQASLPGRMQEEKPILTLYHCYLRIIHSLSMHGISGGWTCSLSDSGCLMCATMLAHLRVLIHMYIFIHPFWRCISYRHLQ